VKMQVLNPVFVKDLTSNPITCTGTVPLLTLDFKECWKKAFRKTRV